MHRFNHEQLEVYQLALRVDELLSSVPAARGHRHLRDQAERASMSVVLNIAEGAGRRSPKDKRGFYAIARGSATELAGAFDLMRARRLATPKVQQEARALLLSVVRMLSKLSENTDPPRISPIEAVEKPEPEPELEPEPPP
jgi:four helix bundle protein